LSDILGCTFAQVQLDSITANELGDPSAIVSIPGHPEMTELQSWETTPRLGAHQLIQCQCENACQTQCGRKV